MISYLIKSGLCLALLLLVYKVLLERERMYVFNRYYLLFGLCFSLVVPFIPIVSTTAIPIVENNATILIGNTVIMPLNVAPEEISNPISWKVYLLVLYAIGGLFFFSRFTSNIYKIFQKIAQNTKAFYKKASLVLLKENVVPHTFLHYIFIDKKAYETNTIADELYTHELAHVTQKHTLDIIFIELIQIVFWFNPLLIFYKKAIQLNHEFLADDAVLKTNTQIPSYQQLLLDNASWNHTLYLASNLNFSVTKKRLQMMTKHTSRVRAWLVASLTIPIFIGALFLFSTKVAAKETTTAAFESSKLKMMTSQDPKANYYKNATFIFEDENGNKTTKTYTELTNDEKATLIPPPKTPVAKRPTTKLLNDWKNAEEFAIWLDGKVIENSEISNYEIVYYTGSFVHKNARSKRFPQTYQMHLYTISGFETLKEELTTPLEKGSVLRLTKRSQNKNQTKENARTTKDKKLEANIQNELAEINKLDINYVNEKSGPNEMEIPTKVKKNTPLNRKDIVVMINKSGKFLVNYEHTADLDNLDKFIKLELSKIIHKRARTGLIIYDEQQKDLISDVKSILKSNKIKDIQVVNNSDIPPPPPPPPAPEVIEIPATTAMENANLARTHQIMKGQKVETMTIKGEKHYYVVKDGVKYIFNEKSQLVDENGKVIPPPPPPPSAPGDKVTTAWEGKELHAGYINVDGETFYYTIKDGKKEFYNRFGERVDENGKKLPPPPPKEKKKG